MDCDSIFLSFKTKDIMKDLSNLKEYFDFSNSDENDELFSNVNRNFVDKFKIETLQCLWIDKLCILGAKSYCSVCSSDKENRAKLEGF